MIGDVGDTIVIEAERATASGRRGVIEEVLQQQPPRYRVRWQDVKGAIIRVASQAAAR